jgi:hypothetical protein
MDKGKGLKGVGFGEQGGRKEIDTGEAGPKDGGTKEGGAGSGEQGGTKGATGRGDGEAVGKGLGTGDYGRVGNQAKSKIEGTQGDNKDNMAPPARIAEPPSQLSPSFSSVSAAQNSPRPVS